MTAVGNDDIYHYRVKQRIHFSGDGWELRLHTGCANRLKEWSDHVLFLNWQMRVISYAAVPKPRRPRPSFLGGTPVGKQSLATDRGVFPPPPNYGTLSS